MLVSLVINSSFNASMKHCLHSLFLIGLCSLAHAYPRSDLPSLTFEHKDWELACDNTRTCRAAGYHVEGADNRISILLTRRAGPNQPLTVEVQPANLDDGSDIAVPPAILNMAINGRSVGTIHIERKTSTGTLSADQVRALLPALLTDAKITWSGAGETWTISTAGSNAVLLKMDEFQGRIGTPGAVVRKGGKSEASVLPPLPAPVIQAVALPEGDTSVTLTAAQSGALLREVRAVSAEDCGQLDQYGKDDLHFVVSRLTSGKLLVSYACSQGAYNTFNGYWVINATPPYAPVLITDSGSDDMGGVITQSQRGRGLADCMSNKEWVWDGRTFAQSFSGSTGMCRAIARSGAWNLPTLVTDVRRKK